MVTSNSEPVLLRIIVSRSDVARLLREIESIEENQRQYDLKTQSLTRAKNTGFYVTTYLRQVAEALSIDIDKSADRLKLANYLSAAKEKAPQIHMDFAVEPSAGLLESIVEWLRLNIDARVLLQTGVQPTIIAGCTLRTSNKFYDFSLRSHFTKAESLLQKEVRAL